MVGFGYMVLLNTKLYWTKNKKGSKLYWTKNKKGSEDSEEHLRHYLCFTQAVVIGFNAKESALAAMVDIEKAYYSVWRNG